MFRDSRSGQWLAVLGRIEQAIAAGAFGVLVLVLFADVLAREFTGAGLPWARQAGVLANVCLILAGFGIASAQGAHLRPRFADRWLPAAMQPLLATLQEALMAAFCMAVAVVAAFAVIETRALSERFSMPAWPVWPFQALLPGAFLLGALRHGLLALNPALRAPESVAVQKDSAD